MSAQNSAHFYPKNYNLNPFKPSQTHIQNPKHSVFKGFLRFYEFSSDDVPYYIRIKHRNHCATWSSVPIQMQLFNIYDFSNQLLKAYGNNQYMVDPTHFAFYTGDINQDEVIDGLDYNDWEDDSNQFAGGYFSSDLNGDGIVDGLDFIYWEQNSNEFIGAVQP